MSHADILGAGTPAAGAPKPDDLADVLPFLCSPEGWAAASPVQRAWMIIRRAGETMQHAGLAVMLHGGLPAGTHQERDGALRFIAHGLQQEARILARVLAVLNEPVQDIGLAARRTVARSGRRPGRASKKTATTH